MNSNGLEALFCVQLVDPNWITTRILLRMVAEGHGTCPPGTWSASSVRLRAYHRRVRRLCRSLVDTGIPATMDQTAHNEEPGMGRQVDGRGRGMLSLQPHLSFQH
jgi:hypothetical protein